MGSEDKELKASKYWNKIQECEKEFKRFLLTFEYPKNYDRIYINLSDYTEQAFPKSKNMNTFLMRKVDPFIMFNENSCFFSLRIPNIWFFGNITGLDDTKLSAIRLNPIGGSSETLPNFTLKEPNALAFIQARLIAQDKTMSKLSQKQSDKIMGDILKNPDRYRKSKTFAATQLDKLRDGDNY